MYSWTPLIRPAWSPGTPADAEVAEAVAEPLTDQSGEDGGGDSEAPAHHADSIARGGRCR